MLRAPSSSAGPIPESSSSRGELTEPPLSTTSRSAYATVGLPFTVYSTPRAAVFDQHPGGQCMRLDRQIASLAGGTQIGRGGAFPARLFLRDVVVAHTVLAGAVEVGGIGQTE